MTLLSLRAVQPEQPVTQSLDRVKWLLGSWTRTNLSEGMSGYEKWSVQSKTAWTGLAATMKQGKQVFQEQLSMIMRDGSLIYIAHTSGNDKPVEFECTSMTDTGFVCENELNEFPKKIEYQLKGSEVIATISGGGEPIEYRFKRMPGK